MLEMLFAAALVASPVQQDEEPPCESYDRDDLSIGVGIAPARPGGEIDLYGNAGLHGMIGVPLRCFSRITSSDPAVSVSAARGKVIIGRDATPGRDVEITGILGGQTVRRRFRIAPVDGPVLTGFWSQTSVDCHGPVPGEPLRELRFSSDGKFAVTFVPFEVRQDYWGPVEFDPAAGRIGFVVESGNTVPPGLMLKGRARVEGENQLLIDGVYFGGLDVAPPAEGCSYVFQRR